MTTWFEEFISGSESIDDIEFWVDTWHEREEDQDPLHEYLGLTLEEYGSWVTNPGSFVEALAKKSKNPFFQRAPSLFIDDGYYTAESGAYVDKGWVPIVLDLLDALLKQQKKGAKVSIVQIKRKFNDLRVYVDMPVQDPAFTDAIMGEISHAERRASAVCPKHGIARSCQSCDGPKIYSVLAMGDKPGSTAIERMALKNVLDDRPFGKGPKFPCRVVFRILKGERYSWWASCRGKDALLVPGNDKEGQRHFDTTQQAIEWLKEEENK